MKLRPKTKQDDENELGYRFDLNEDPNNKIWAFGCSYSYGYELKKTETWAAHLGIMNFARSAVGPDFIWDALCRLLSEYRPKAVVIQWPNVNRLYDPGHDLPLGPWMFEEYPYYANLATKRLVKKYNRSIVNMTRERLKFLKIPYVEFRFDSRWFWYDKIPTFPSDRKAPDGSHPGPEQHKKIAIWLAPQLGLDVPVFSK